MRREWVVGLLVFLAACNSPTSWRSEEYNEYYRQPSTEKRSSTLGRNQIVYRTQAGTTKTKRRLGMIERREILLEGSRSSREHYIILDAHFQEVGLITEEGKFYRFDEQGRRVYIGEYVIGNDPERKMFMTGLKVFFGIPLQDGTTSHDLALEEIDPYGDF